MGEVCDTNWNKSDKKYLTKIPARLDLRHQVNQMKYANELGHIYYGYWLATKDHEMATELFQEWGYSEDDIKSIRAVADSIQN